jgi:hypothetical protein
MGDAVHGEGVEPDLFFHPRILAFRRVLARQIRSCGRQRGVPSFVRRTEMASRPAPPKAAFGVKKRVRSFAGRNFALSCFGRAI